MLYGISAATALRLGPAADAILTAAVDLGAELIVMTTRGRSDMERLLVGSVAAKVLQTADVPVLRARACVRGLPAPVREHHDVSQR